MNRVIVTIALVVVGLTACGRPALTDPHADCVEKATLYLAEAQEAAVSSDQQKPLEDLCTMKNDDYKDVINGLKWAFEQG